MKYDKLRIKEVMKYDKLKIKEVLVSSSLECDRLALLNNPLLLGEAGCWQSRGPVLTHY